ncbi:MAG TPA: hypothetical protein GX532_00850 [Clostridia bacterium]|nr:hypothetical protein [Clostridia bacterium]
MRKTFFINRLVAKLRGENNKIEANKIEYPSEYYQETRDIKENLLMYEEAIKKIKTRYAPYSLEQAFREKFGEELSDVDFVYQDRITAYCERNRVTEEQLLEFERQIMPQRKRVCQKINEEIELAKYHVMLRDGQTVSEEMVSLEKRYGNPDKAEELKKKLRKVKGNEEKFQNKESARVIVLRATMSTIKSNINPYGKEPEAKYKDDWVRKIDYVRDELAKKGLDTQSYGQNEEINRAWGEICLVAKNERSARLYSVDGFIERSRQEDSKKEVAEKKITRQVWLERCIKDREL